MIFKFILCFELGFLAGVAFLVWWLCRSDRTADPTPRTRITFMTKSGHELSHMGEETWN